MSTGSATSKADLNIAEYRAYLREDLQPILEAVLHNLLKWKPQDAIDFIAAHLRHLRIGEGNSLICVDSCSICERSASKKSKDQQITEDLLQQSCLATSWQKVNIVSAWATLRAKHGNQLHWWHVADALASQATPQPIRPVFERSPSFSVILFVSSTFSDMHDERDCIVNDIVDELQEACRPLDLQITPIDLRWGVASGTSFEVCMNQIKRCREQNVMPYFLCLLGDRYGFVPKDLPDDQRRDFCYIPGMSVTATEICSGALWNSNPNALFLIRNSRVIDKVLEKFADVEGIAATMQAYRSVDPESRLALEKLKQLVRKHLPAQVMDYTCEIGEALEQNGSSQKPVLSNFKCLDADGTPFGKFICDFFLHRLKLQYPLLPTNTVSSALDLQRKQHLLFVNMNVGERTGRKEESNKIYQYIEEDVRPRKLSKTLILTGPGGVGKTCLLANIASDYCDKQNNCSQGKAVFVHFVGIAPNSTSLEAVLRRIWYECLDVPEDQIPTDITQLKFSLFSVLFRASDRVRNMQLQRLVIFLDALNQLDDEHDALKMTWLPKHLPENVRLIVSVISKDGNDQLLESLRLHKCQYLEISALSEGKRMEVIKKFLERYGKSLTDEQMQQLVSKRDAGLPLWLKHACEEMRVYGRFPTFQDKIRSLGDTLPVLIGQVIDRLVKEHPERSAMARAAWIMICVSRFGLTELEMRALLAIKPVIPTTESDTKVENKTIPIELWLEINLNVGKLLRPVRSATGRLDFYHRSSYKAVKQMFLQDSNVRRLWNRRLAEFFEHSSDKIVSLHRKSIELPYQLVCLNDWRRLRRVFLDYSIFEQLDKDVTRLKFATTWKKITTSYYLVARCYEHALREKWLPSWFPEKVKAVLEIDGRVRLWGKRVIGFSSQLSEGKGAAKNISGHPKLYPVYDIYALFINRTWAPKNVGSEHEFIEIEFEKAIYVTAVNVYECFNAGAISRIALRDESGQWQTVYTAKRIMAFKRARIFRPRIKPTTYRSNAVRIELDQRVSESTRRLVQIDAVCLDGYENSVQAVLDATSPSQTDAGIIRQYVMKVNAFSSQYHDTFSSTSELIGRPNVHPRKLLFPGSCWCTAEDGTKDEFVELEFEKSVYVVAVELYEVQNAGGVSRIALKDPNGQWTTVYSNSKPQRIDEARRFVPDIDRPKWKTKEVRIEIDQSACVSGLRYVQIDALALYGFEDAQVATDVSAAEQVCKYYEVNPMYDDEADDQEERQLLKILRSLTPSELDKWLTAAYKCARFFNDLQAFANLESFSDFHAMSENNARYAKWCYKIFQEVLPESSSNEKLGKLVAASHINLQGHIDEAIVLFEKNSETVSQRTLVELYAAKGYAKIVQGDVDGMLEFFEKSHRLADRKYSSHLSARAEVHRLYANSLLNAADWHVPKSKKQYFYEKSLKHYRQELQLRESLFSTDHPHTKRACRNAVLVLEELRRFQQADEMKVKYSITD